MISLDLDPETIDFLDRLERFIDEHVVPVERELQRNDIRERREHLEQEVIPQLRVRARTAGVYGPQLPKAFGGLELPLTTLAFVSERCGPHRLASLAINMMAPDEASMHLLERFGTPAQQEMWLRPLAAGEMRSCFGMTEPDAGADPRRITTTATPTADGWRIDGRKAFTSGAIGARVCIVMANADPSIPRAGGISMFLVPTDAPGFRIIRELEPMGYYELGGLCETEFDGVEIGREALLGEVGAGLAMAQARLGRGRIGHAMRWIGIAQRALDLGAQRSLERVTFGETLSRRQAVQWWLADGATQLRASRLLVLDALWRMEQGLPHDTEVSMIKTFVAEALNKIVDDALQIFGGWGYTDDFPLSAWYRDARSARIYDGPSEVHRWVVARKVLKEVEQHGTAAAICGDLRTVAGRAGV
jgi:acyl-CoA dehydrogenase